MALFDAHKDFAYSTIPVGGAPSPSTSGNSLKVASSSDRALFPTPPFRATVWPANSTPLATNAEIIQVNGTTGTDGFIISRAQEGSTAQPIVGGYQIAATITTKPFTDLEKAVTDLSYNVKNYGAVGDGTTDDTAAIQAAITAAGLAGGGLVFFPKGTYLVMSSINCKYSNLSLQGVGKYLSILKCGFDGSGGSLNSFGGVLTFRDNSTGTTIINNGTVRDLGINLNSYATNGIHVRATDNAQTMSNFLIESVDIFGRGIDNTGSVGAIKFTGDYATNLGQLQNVTLRQVTIHDGVATTSSKSTGYSVLILANSLSNVLFDRCTFTNVYGATISCNSTAGVRVRSNWRFESCSYINTIQLYWGQGLSNFVDGNRYGFNGIKFLNDYVDQSAYSNTWTYNADNSLLQDISHINCYNNSGFHLRGGFYFKLIQVLAPGGPASAGSGTNGQSIGSIIADNTVYQCHHFQDPDANYATEYTNNIFYGLIIAGIMGGYGRHQPTRYSDNLFYNVGLLPQTGDEIYSAIFGIEDGGNIVEGNVVYDDTPSTKLKYFVAELSAGGQTANPNVYRNNTITGTGVSTLMFRLDSDYKHIIQNNSGLPETIIQNSITHGATSITPLVSADIVSGNFKMDGTPIRNNSKTSGIQIQGITNPGSAVAGYSTIYYEATSKQLYYQDETGARFLINTTAGTSTSTSSTSTSSTSTSSTSTSVSTSSTSTSVSTSSTSSSTSSTSTSKSSTSISISTSSTSQSTSSTSTSTTVISFG